MNADEMTRYLLAPWTERGIHLEDVDKRILKIIAALRAGSHAAELLRNLQEGGDIGGITEAHDKRIKRDIDSVLEAWDKSIEEDV